MSLYMTLGMYLSYHTRIISVYHVTRLYICTSITPLYTCIHMPKGLISALPIMTCKGLYKSMYCNGMVLAPTHQLVRMLSSDTSHSYHNCSLGCSPRARATHIQVLIHMLNHTNPFVRMLTSDTSL